MMERGWEKGEGEGSGIKESSRGGGDICIITDGIFSFRSFSFGSFHGVGRSTRAGEIGRLKGRFIYVFKNSINLIC